MSVDDKLAEMEMQAKKRADDLVKVAQAFGYLDRGALALAALHLREEGILGPTIGELLSRGEAALGTALAEFA